MQKRWSFLAVAVLAVGIFTTTVYGGPRGGWHGHRGGHGDGFGILSPFVLRKLELTDEQQAKVKQIRDEHRSKFASAFKDLHTLRTEIGDRFFAPGGVQPSDFTAQLDRAADLRKQAMQEGLAVALKIRALLTPEQLAKAAELRTQFRELREQMKELHGDDL